MAAGLTRSPSAARCSLGIRSPATRPLSALYIITFMLLSACQGPDTYQEPPLTLERLQDPEACKVCHPGQYAEWSGSMHAYASFDPLFLAMNRRGQRETGGELGVHAMLDQWKPDRGTVKAWKETLKTQLKAFRPRRLRMRNEANWITVDEVKPLTTASIVHTPVFQLRAVKHDGGGEPLWFLYWRRAGGSWWPYAGKPSFDSIEGAVQEVVSDPYSCFRLHPLR